MFDLAGATADSIGMDAEFLLFKKLQDELHMTCTLWTASPKNLDQPVLPQIQ